MNNGHIEVRDEIDNHIIREEEMTQGTINHLKREFVEDEIRFEKAKRLCARVREYERRTFCYK